MTKDYTTLHLTGGCLGRDQMLVRCEVHRAESPVEVDYCQGEGWQPTQYQGIHARSRGGLAAIARELAADAVVADRSEAKGCVVTDR